MHVITLLQEAIKSYNATTTTLSLIFHSKIKGCEALKKSISILI